MKVLLFCVSLLVPCSSLFADDTALMVDRNGDGVISLTAFGDSITFGIGDGLSPGAFIESSVNLSGGNGYPGRIEELLGVPVKNEGRPGDRVTTSGVARFPASLRAVPADSVLIMEGVNDAIFRTSQESVRRGYQRMINVAFALGVTPALVTLIPPCCNDVDRAPFARGYSQEMRNLGSANQIEVIDLEEAWDIACPPGTACALYNLPEGLHPNTRGYDAIGQFISAYLSGIDLLTPNGIEEFESSFGLAAGSVVFTPRPMSEE